MWDRRRPRSVGRSGCGEDSCSSMLIEEAETVRNHTGTALPSRSTVLPLIAGILGLICVHVATCARPPPTARLRLTDTGTLLALTLGRRRSVTRPRTPTRPPHPGRQITSTRRNGLGNRHRSRPTTVHPLARRRRRGRLGRYRTVVTPRAALTRRAPDTPPPADARGSLLAHHRRAVMRFGRRLNRYVTGSAWRVTSARRRLAPRSPMSPRKDGAGRFSLRSSHTATAWHQHTSAQKQDEHRRPPQRDPAFSYVLGGPPRTIAAFGPHWGGG